MQPCLETDIALCGMHTIPAVGPVKIDDAAGDQKFRRPLEQTFRRGPWGDVNQIDGDNPVKWPLDLIEPPRPRDIYVQWFSEVRNPGIGPPRGDAGSCIGGRIARTPVDAGESLRKRGGVLTGSAGDFENNTGVGQMAP